ncbi:hypothetical protein B0A49_04870, partial [Cryomyces minteri]
MEFLSAVASAISKGPSFPYFFGDRVDVEQSIWTLNNGTKREDGSKCSIFSFDVTANKSRLPLARNAVRKLRTLRHPGVIKVLDTVETDTYIYIATERLTPLGWHVRRRSMAEETVKWGLYNVAKTLKFINDEGSSVHGCIRTSSIFTSESGEWKLAGFDVLSSMKEEDAIIYTYGSLVPDSGRYAPPEISKSGWEIIKSNPVSAVDAYSFGILIYEAFNGSFAGTDQLLQTKSIPLNMHQTYKRLLNANPKARLSIGHYLEQGQRSGGFFETPLIRLAEGIESIGLKNETEREDLLTQLDAVSDDFPEEFFKMKVLPELLKSVEFGGGGPKVFSVVMRISAKLSDEEYDAQITPVVVRLFTSPDRAIRVCLLDNLPLMIDHLSKKIVNDKIFPQLVTGFTDLAPVVREQTVKAVLTIIGKLSDRTINGELLRYLAKSANDEQPGIRTNTTICLGKIARYLGNNTRGKVLSAAFARSLRDPFVHARNAALMALAATSDVFTEEECANKMLPTICPSLVDKEKIVRDQANKTLDIYLQRIRKYGQTLPDSVLPPPTASEGINVAVPRMGTPQNDTSWAGWAISSFTNKIASAKGDMQASTNDKASRPAEPQRSLSVPSSVNGKLPQTSSGTASPLQRQALAAPSATNSLNNVPATNTSLLDVEDEDFDASWGDNPDSEDAWDDPSENPFSRSQPKPKPSTNTASKAPSNLTDTGEPDFAGWLNAQAAAKSKAKTSLPKGLTKPATGRPAAV